MLAFIVIFWQSDLYHVIKTEGRNDYWEKKTSFAFLFSSKPNLVSHLFENKVILSFSVIWGTLCYRLYFTIIMSCLMLHAKTDPECAESITWGLLPVTVSSVLHYTLICLSPQNVNVFFTPIIVPGTWLVLQWLVKECMHLWMDGKNALMHSFQSTHSKNILREGF